MDHTNSARKKLLEYQDDLKKSQIRSGLFQRTLSRQHSKFMQSVLRQNIQRQQSDRIIKKQSSSKNYNSNPSNGSNQIINSNRSINIKTPSSKNKLISNNNINHNQLENSVSLGLSAVASVVKYKPLNITRSIKQENHIKVQVQSQQNQSENKNNLEVPQYLNQTDQIRSARQNQLLQAKKIYFQFSFVSYIAEVLIAYGITFGILYLIKLGQFPYYQILFILALTLTIVPWKISNIIMLITAIPITIINSYLGLSVLTYFQIFICYIAVLMFNEKHKIKIVFIVILAFQLLFGFLILPAIASSYTFPVQDRIVYIYMFPLFMFIIRNFVQIGYWVIGYSTGLFLQIPLFLMGLQYGTILSVSYNDIQFWYLIVFFSLQIMNDRTHFFLNVIINLIKFCFPKMKVTPTPDSKKKNNHILSAHWNGFSCIHSFHIICCIYIFTQLPLYASPYTSSLTLYSYIDGQTLKPFIIWILAEVYQIMCLILKRNKKNTLLYGYTNNSWYLMIVRGLTLVLGLWIFYMGLGVGKLVFSKFTN